MQTPGSPFNAAQRLCIVDVFKHRVVQKAVGPGNVRFVSSRSLSYSFIERGLETESDRTPKSKYPADALPPLHKIMQSAVAELDIQLPSKESKAGRSPKGSSIAQPRVVGRSSSQPRLPLRRSTEVLEGLAEARRQRHQQSSTRRTASVQLEEPQSPGRITSGPVAPASGTTGLEGWQSEADCRLEQCGIATRISGNSGQLDSSDVFPAAPSPSPPEAREVSFPWSEEDIRAAFARFDTDGEVHKDELHQLLCFLDAHPEDGDARKIAEQISEFATVNRAEIDYFLHAFCDLQFSRVKDRFDAADVHRTGFLDFEASHALLANMGLWAAPSMTLEALQALDLPATKLNAYEFADVFSRLRASMGFNTAELKEIQLIFARMVQHSAASQQPGSSPSSSRTNGHGREELLPHDVWRLINYLGFSITKESVKRLFLQLGSGFDSASFSDVLRVLSALREEENQVILKVMREAASADLSGRQLAMENLSIVLHSLGYFVSEQSICEIVELMPSIEDATKAFLTIAEVTDFLKEYRKIEGYTKSELQEFREAFLQQLKPLKPEVKTGRRASEIRDRPKDIATEQEIIQGQGVNALQLGRLLRWFGFARTLQQTGSLMDEVDLDNNGAIDFVEFLKLVRRLGRQEDMDAIAIFDSLDVARMGSISAFQLPFAASTLVGLNAPVDRVVEAAAMSGIEITLQSESGKKVLSAVMVTRQQFQGFLKNYKQLSVADVRKSAGYSAAEIAQLQQIFALQDTNKSGTLEGPEICRIVMEYFPSATRSMERQARFQLALKQVDTNRNRHLAFPQFVQLMRLLDDERDAEDVSNERKVVKACDYLPEEVDGFRKIFASSANWAGQLGFAGLCKILSQVLDFSESEVQSLRQIVWDVNSQSSIASDSTRFPQFLQVLKRITSENYCNVNFAASRQRGRKPVR